MHVVRDEDKAQDTLKEIEALREQLPANVEGSKEFNEANKQVIEEQKVVKIKSIIVMAKLDDDTVHLISLDRLQQLSTLQLLVQTSKGNALWIEEKAQEGINWETDIDLTIEERIK